MGTQGLRQGRRQRLWSADFTAAASHLVDPRGTELDWVQRPGLGTRQIMANRVL